MPDIPDTRERRAPELPAVKQLHWRIYFMDGTTIGSHESSWNEARKTGVVAVVHALNDEKPTVEIGTPYYWCHGDWIARTWDVTLYLRQTGMVKFGRWASHELFRQAWVSALRQISPKNIDRFLTPDTLGHGLIANSYTLEPGDAVPAPWQLFYDDGTMRQGAREHWADAPSDGVLCATYAIPYSGVWMRFAMRRYTFYYWRAHELINTDNLDDVLMAFPQCKIGVPTFCGSSYRHMGIAIAAAHADTLEGVR